MPQRPFWGALANALRWSLQPAMLIRQYRFSTPLTPNHRKRLVSGPFDDPRLPHHAILMDDGRLAWPVAEGNGVAIEVFYTRLSIRWSAEKAATYPAPPRQRRSPPQRPSLKLSTYLADGRLAWPVAASRGVSEMRIDGYVIPRTETTSFCRPWVGEVLGPAKESLLLARAQTCASGAEITSFPDRCSLKRGTSRQGHQPAAACPRKTVGCLRLIQNQVRHGIIGSQVAQ